ncbi:hypothetical protein TIFTF001_020599 [Ficus carica]|uniref:DNA polymerase epsilon subunit B N-terminal domain-containing protein n=1 Tax=Ficus carica TaxID=3494 RepID=A0AA88AGD7_FICCA|nr:hypothetical protein TIFTF001_020599 [Ficus carica]
MSGSSASLRKKVQRKCKIRGYSVKVDAIDEILSFTSGFPDSDCDEAIDLLLDQLHHRTLKSPIVDKEAVRSVVSLLLDADDAVDGDEASAAAQNAAAFSSSIRVIDTFLVPKLRYDPIKKLFYEYTGSLPIYGDASTKAALYRDRYLLLFQRVTRDQHFSKPAFDSEMSHFGNCEISPIQSLVGQTGRRWVMGLISQLEDGHFYLEDLTASVEINLSDAISFYNAYWIYFLILEVKN